ncbi:MAG: EamA family transporter [Bryobacterales bacterium]|nr:EamA family transporter [Bryobacterales bacterium]
MTWAYLVTMVLATTASEVLQSWDMKRHGEVDDFRPGALAGAVGRFLRRLPILASIGFHAISFFAFLKLLEIADLSFAVPASAASIVLETMLARWLLKEHVHWQRWCGTALVAAGVMMILT